MTGLVRVDAPADRVVRITLDNPKVNALSSALLAELSAVLDGLAETPPTVLVVTGGDRIFAAGADISEFGGQVEAAKITGAFHDALDRLAAFPAFVVASVAGPALGGGCELALACDYRIASERASFGQPEILLGIIPGGGGTQRLARTVGASRAKEMMVTGRRLSAADALAVGLVDEVVASDDLVTRTMELARQVAAGPSVAIRLVKRAVDEGLGTGIDAGLALEKRLFVEVFGTEDAAVGVRSFLEDGPGKASFTGR
jgi:enoyl-CoA hydratase